MAWPDDPDTDARIASLEVLVEVLLSELAASNRSCVTTAADQLERGEYPLSEEKPVRAVALAVETLQFAAQPREAEGE